MATGITAAPVAAAAAMGEHGGAIVVTASVAGIIPWPPDPFYTATKHGAVGWVRAIAPALASSSITNEQVANVSELMLCAAVPHRSPDIVPSLFA
jgi:NAD(P)-dependent dehydrogenase (short-subunit alcohol dehydrogenase family)